MSESMPLYDFQVVPVATAAALGVGPKRLMKVVIGGNTANSTVHFHNGLTHTGDVLLTLSALADAGGGVDLTDVGGLPFSTGCFVVPTGTACTAYCWFE
jgi:hypothetical protein